MLEPGERSVTDQAQTQTRPLAGTPRDQAAVAGRAAAERAGGPGLEHVKVEEPADYDIDSMAQWAHWV